MTDEKIRISAEKLYRHYQETRDDIPLSTFNSLSLAAEKASQDDAIHSILEAAKVASYSNSKEFTGKKSSLLTSIGEKLKSGLFGGNLYKPVGVGFACLAMVAVVGPMFLNNVSPLYKEVAHLDDCAQCSSHINNVLTTTRSATPGFSQIDAQSRYAAKLGTIQARLKIEANTDSKLAIDNAITALKKLDRAMLSQELGSLISKESTRETTTVDSLNTAILSATKDPAVTLASEAVFIANISARQALEINNSEAARAPLELALLALKGLPSPTNLQKSAVLKLERSVQAETLNLKGTIKSLELSAKSLGV